MVSSISGGVMQQRPQRQAALDMGIPRGPWLRLTAGFVTILQWDSGRFQPRLRPMQRA
jgi:hypothetical protein